MEQYRYKELTGLDTAGRHGIAYVEITPIDKSKSNGSDQSLLFTLLRGPTTINQDRCAGDKAASVAGEKDNYSANFIRGCPALQWYSANKVRISLRVLY